MKITDCINSPEKTVFSIEVLPPIKGTGLTKLFESIDKINEFGPKYINITTHHSEYVYTDLGNGMFKRQAVRRRPGTVAVATALKHRYDIPVVPHILCNGFTPEETEYVLIDLQLSGITDLLLLRGDKAKDEKAFTPTLGGYDHTVQLQEQVNKYNDGLFIDGTPIRERGERFSYGVACYPEKHIEAPNLETDLYWLKKKADNGAEYAVTQMFFDNEKYFTFVQKAREMGITIPIIPGIKPIHRMSQINILPKTFNTDLPGELTNELLKCKSDADAAVVGYEWCVNQCRELMKRGVPSLHFYTINAMESVYNTLKAIY